jgi:hypothetical protein
MDTAVRVTEGTQLQDLTKAKAAKVKRLRWAVLMEEWQPQPRDTTVDAGFVTVPQQMRGLLAYLTKSLSGRMHRYSRCSRACLPCLVWFSSFSLTPS